MGIPKGVPDEELQRIADTDLTPHGAGQSMARELLSRRSASTQAPVAVKPLDDDQIMAVIKEAAPWKSEPKLYDLLTYEKSPPMFPQATYDVPSFRATALVRAIEQRIRSALASPVDDQGVREGEK